MWMTLLFQFVYDIRLMYKCVLDQSLAIAGRMIVDAGTWTDVRLTGEVDECSKSG